MYLQYTTVAEEGFYGAYAPHPKGSNSVIIVALSDSIRNHLVMTSIKWVHSLGCNALAIAPGEKAEGYHNMPLEYIGRSINWLKSNGNQRIGFAGGSTTAMLALISASYFPEITFTVAISPSDFVMEGFYKDGLDGAKERPGQNESTVSRRGEPLPYLPFAYRHPVYWEKLSEEARRGGNIAASREMFEESERLHPVTERETIKTEKICGTLILIGAEDDCLWDTFRYIRRIQARLKEKGASCRCIPLLFEHGTHFLFPQSWLKKALPVGGDLLVGLAFRAGREFPRECRASRLKTDRVFRRELEKWLAE